MKNRILENWKSSLLGLLIFAACGVAVYTKMATFAEVVGFLTTSGLLMWVKDTIFKV